MQVIISIYFLSFLILGNWNGIKERIWRNVQVDVQIQKSVKRDRQMKLLLPNASCTLYKELHNIPTDYVHGYYTPRGCFYKSWQEHTKSYLV